MSLKAYAKKRDFKKTAEPRGKVASGKGHRFVIQKHAASRLHYDFRLEIDGTLKSWAVPKGIPFAHGEKRLAVHVEDHPVSYIDFEGTIPKGQYGGGTVMVWDRGTFTPDTATPGKDLAGGKLHFTLKGKKLKGAWYLVRIRDPEDDQWLLIRGGDDLKPVSAKQDDTSVLSGKSMKALAQSDQVWKSKPAPAAKPRKTKAVAAPAPAKPPAHRTGKRVVPLKFVEPMKARLVEAPPAGDWTYEIKFDGFRALALKNAAGTQLLSRNNKDLADNFPEVAAAVAALDVNDAIIDGEIVALDDQGRSSFQLLQAYELGDAKPPLHYYVFDLLRLNGESLVDLPLAERKARLKKLLGRKTAGVIRYSASLGSDADALLTQARSIGLEGLIGKRTGSTYETGRRSGAWIKLKLHHEQEFVIGGYTPARRQPHALRGVAHRRAPREEAVVFRQGRDGFQSRAAAHAARALSKTAPRHVSVRQPARDQNLALRADHHGVGDEDLPLAQAGAGVPGAILRMDARRQPAPAGLPRPARGQGRRGSCPRKSRRLNAPAMASIKTTLDVDGKKVEVSNLQKVMYPETGFTKGDVIDYYIKISEHLLPHLKNRPITLKRYPDGVDGFFFYEKQCPPHRPKWVKTTDVPKSDGTDIHYCVMNDLPALVWAANLADLELHTFLHKAPAIGRPNALAFDLDPGLPADILTCAKVGL